MNLNSKIGTVLWGVLLSVSSAVGFSESQTRPNVVVIMADDIGLGDLGFYHHERTQEEPVVPTVNIDRLIGEGLRFSDAHSASSLCAPTRFSMMTGNFVYRNKAGNGSFSPVGDSLIEPDFTTVARTAKKGGYHTAFFGKWGLGSVWSSRDSDMSKIEMGARYFGFDYAYETPQGLQNWPHAFYENQQWIPIEEDSELVQISKEQARHSKSGIGDSNWNPETVGPKLAEKATAYIGRQTAEHPEEPFYLYYCSQAVHIPHTPPKELDGVKIAGATGDDHGDMILELDVQVGMLVKALKKAGVYENTLIVFTSDNGGLNKGKVIGSKGHLSSGGLTGKKGSCYEGGHRVPFVAVWPGVIAPNSTSDEPEPGHKHVAHLWAICESDLITLGDTPELFDASRKALDKRVAHGSDKTAVFRGNTGWIAQSYARLLAGEEAYRILHYMIADSSYDNLFATSVQGLRREMWETDANLGCTATIAELFLQSHAGYIELLPAMPEALNTGSIRGLSAQGAFEVDLEWSKGQLVSATIHSKKGNGCRLKFGAKTIEFETRTGESYTFNGTLKRQNTLNE